MSKKQMEAHARMQRRGDCFRYVGYALHPFLALTTMGCLHVFEEHRLWIVLVALLVAGPGFFMFVENATPAPSKWLHDLETAGTLALFLWLCMLLPQGILSVAVLGITIGIMIMLSNLILDSLYHQIQKYSISEGLLCTCLVLIVAVACVLEMAAATQYPKAGVALLGLLFVPYFLFWRSRFFYGAWNRFPLAAFQHRAWWPIAFATNEKSSFWLDVMDYSSKFKVDAPNIFNALRVEQLLTFFDIAQYEEAREWFDPLRDHCKQAINEKEPRALVAWNMHDNDLDAAHCIKNMLEPGSKPKDLPTLELPL